MDKNPPAPLRLFHNVSGKHIVCRVFGNYANKKRFNSTHFEPKMPPTKEKLCLVRAETPTPTHKSRFLVESKQKARNFQLFVGPKFGAVGPHPFREFLCGVGDRPFSINPVAHFWSVVFVGEI